MNRSPFFNMERPSNLRNGDSKTCVMCGAAFIVTRHHKVARCCSKACQVKYSSERFNGVPFHVRERTLKAKQK
jgi:hypothetical protein